VKAALFYCLSFLVTDTDPIPHPEERSVSKDEGASLDTGSSFETQTSSVPQDEIEMCKPVSQEEAHFSGR
jgi:hypothetical protein